MGCGTGTFALRRPGRGLQVTGVDRAGGSIDFARAKPGANRVRWIQGDACALPPVQVDLVTMTANVAQAIVDPPDWEGTLRGVYDALRPGGRFFFETRDPAYPAWQKWNRAEFYSITEIQGVGALESRVEVVEVSGPLVRFRWTWVTIWHVPALSGRPYPPRHLPGRAALSCTDLLQNGDEGLQPPFELSAPHGARGPSLGRA